MFMRYVGTNITGSIFSLVCDEQDRDTRYLSGWHRRKTRFGIRKSLGVVGVLPVVFSLHGDGPNRVIRSLVSCPVVGVGNVVEV